MRAFYLLVVCFLSFSLSAQDKFDPVKMDAFLDHLEQNQKAMGSMALFKDGEEIYHYAIGHASVEDNIELTTSHRLRIGSISKTYTAAVIFQLVDEGKLTLDQKLSDFYPTLEGSKSITIEHLLRHRSGLYNFTNDEEYLEWNEIKHTKEELLARFKAKENVFEAGSKAEYSNTNYALLSFIIEDVTDMPFRDNIDKRIFQKCSCKDSREGEGIDPNENAADSYNKAAEWVDAGNTDMSVPVGAGSISATASDVSRFYDCLFRKNLVSNASLTTMKKIEEGYGAGLFQFPYGERKAFGHTGGIDGFNTMTGHFEEEGLTVTYLSSGTDYSVNDIMIAALDLYFTGALDLPEIIEPVMVDESILKTYEGTYSSQTFPLKLKIFVENGILNGQATGQGAFPLEGRDDTTFVFDPAKIKITFDAKASLLNMDQGGFKVAMKKE